MQKEFDFRDLFVLDMANNHQGELAQGRRIIAAMREAVERAGVRAAIKFQFRQLDSFIHPSHQLGSDLPYVQRFASTRLEADDFAFMRADVRAAGMLAMCTPFDEESLPLILDQDFDLIKVASCSARDWPLLEAVAQAGKPVVVSTGALGLDEVDNLVSFLQHRGVEFALMHCIAIYPTPDQRMALSQIRALKERYPDLCIGWSTHESPSDTTPVQLAVALGAELFERHVGVESDATSLNAYSSTPEQVARWLEAWARARTLCGPAERPSACTEERAAIDGLRRGVFAREPIAKGREIRRDQVYFAIPYAEGQLESGHWRPGIRALRDHAGDQALEEAGVSMPDDARVQVIKRAVHQVKAMLNEARIQLGTDFKIEYSHHHGVENFRETGAVIIECINREYCKKLVVQLPGQRHPAHYHPRKEETFQILHGRLEVEIDGRNRTLLPGDTLLIQPGVWHAFGTAAGCVFEEVSTTHHAEDSVYRDSHINALQSDRRKTVVDNWGRFQLRDETGAAPFRAPKGTFDARCVVFDYEALLRSRGGGDHRESVRQVLRRLQEAGMPVFVNASTPSPAVLSDLKRDALDAYISGVHGGPASKLENLRLIADQLGVESTALLVVGAGEPERRVAVEAGSLFVEVGPREAGADVSEAGHRRVDLRELPGMIAMPGRRGA